MVVYRILLPFRGVLKLFVAIADAVAEKKERRFTSERLAFQASFIELLLIDHDFDMAFFGLIGAGSQAMQAKHVFRRKQTKQQTEL